MQSTVQKISHYLWIVSFCGLALFIPFSISGANISIMFGFLASILAMFTDPAARARYREIKSDPLFWASILLVISALPAVMMSENFSRAFNDWQSYWLLLIYFLVAYNLVSAKLRRLVYWILLGSASASCLVAVAQYRGGIDFLFIHIEPEPFRPGSTLYNMTFAGILYQLIVLNLSVGLKERRPNRSALFIGVAVVLQITALLLTLTRGAWLALLAGLSVIPFLLRSRTLIVAGAGILIVVGIFAARNESLRARAATLVHNIRNPDKPTDIDFFTRLVLWDISWEVFKAHPVLGVGMGDYSIEAEKIVGERRITTTVDSHNIYLQLLATRGLVGFIPFVIFWVVLFKVLFDARRRIGPTNRFGYHFATGAIAAAVAVLIGALSENNIDDSEVFIAFMFIVGTARSFDLYGRQRSPIDRP